MFASESLHEQIRIVHNRGLFAEAAEMARAGLEFDPDDARLWESLGLAWHALRDFGAAMEALEQATVLKPLSPGAELALAGCYLVSGRKELARSAYRNLALRPGVSLHLLRPLAAGLLQTGEPHWAVDVQRRYALEHPHDDDALYALAHYMKLAHYPPELIRSIADQAFRTNPLSLRNRTLLALMHHSLGDHDRGYQLLVTVDLHALLSGTCACRLYGLASLFAAVGDQTRYEACLAQLATLKRVTPHAE